MNDTMTRIELGGILGKTFGKVHHRSVATSKEAIKALAVTVKGFEQFLNHSKKRGLTFSVFNGQKNIGVDDLGFPLIGKVVRIVPVIIGSKRAGLLQTILGVALLAVAIWNPAFLGMSSSFAAGLGAAGASMALGGVIQMLSPQAKGLAMSQDADNKASYAFGGVTNTAAQGYPVALCYGKPRIGGAIISAGIYVEDQQ